MKLYLQPRSFYDAAMITDTGDRVIYDDEALQQLLSSEYLHAVKTDYRFANLSEVRQLHEARKQAHSWLRYLRGSLIFSNHPIIAYKCTHCRCPILTHLQACPASDDETPCIST